MRGSNIELADKTFTLVTPQDSDTVPAIFVNKLAGGRAVSPTLSLQARPINGDKLSTKVSLTLLVPVVRTTDSQESVVATIPYEVSGRLPKEATEAEISAAFGLLKDMLENSQAVAVLCNGERII